MVGGGMVDGGAGVESSEQASETPTSTKVELIHHPIRPVDAIVSPHSKAARATAASPQQIRRPVSVFRSLESRVGC